MMEIAICLAIIGFALVAIIGVLPIGMNTQRDNRQETIINQDATVLLNDVRSGARGSDDLTNYVYAITNYWTIYRFNGSSFSTLNSGVNGYTFQGASVTSPTYIPNNPNGGGPYSPIPLTNNAAIISLLSTPEFIVQNANFPPVPNLAYVAWRYGNNARCYSNHVVAYIRSLSGVAAEKPPQDNPIMRDDTFTYHLYCVNASIPVDTNIFYNSYNPNETPGFGTQLAANQRELRMTFLWPQYPNGKVGMGRHTFRVTIAGQLQWETNYYNGLAYYFYQPQFFTNSP